MGYSHYWKRNPTISLRTYALMVADFERVQPVMRQRGLLLAGPMGSGRPVVNSQEIAFNGRIRCRHAAPSEINVFADMLRVATVMSLPDGEREAEGRRLWEEEHTRRRCPGDCSFESFHFPRRMPRGYPRNGDGTVWDRVKTNFRPYDVAVTVMLLIARRHLGDRLIIESDGGQSQWWDARLLCQSVLGYGLTLPLGLHDERAPI